MKEEAGTGTVRCVMLSDLPAQACEYNYEIDGKIVTDSYAKGIAGRERWNDQADFTPHQVRGKLPQKEEYPWEDDCPLRDSGRGRHCIQSPCKRIYKTFLFQSEEKGDVSWRDGKASLSERAWD